MEHKLSPQLHSRLKPVAIYQIIGGIIGLGLTFWLITNLTVTNLALYALISLAVALNGYSIFCGILLLNKRESGLKHTLINQILQLVSFSILGYTYQYVSGLFFEIGIDLTDTFSFNFNVGISTWRFIIGGEKEPLILNFNLIALGLIIFIQKIKAKANRENVDKQIDAIGQADPSPELQNE